MLSCFTRIKLTVTRLISDDSAQGLTEYALILSLVVITAILALTFLGGSAQSALSTVGNSLPAN